MVVATIEQITEIRPHPNADLLELATIKGWQVCVKKNEFKVNDLCAFITVDSIFDPHPSVEFLRNKGFRIKTCRLRGELSQGIAFPVSFLNERGISSIPDVGQDISSVIGCKHYEKPVPACLMGIALGNFPTFLRKTDEDNIKNYPLIIDELRGRKYYISVKLDGCSGTFYVKEDHFGVCSRNLELTETQDNSFWKVARQYQVESELRRIFPDRNIAVQGEVYGNGIQDNIMGEPDIKLAIFNVFDIDKQKYLGYDVLSKIRDESSLSIVPIIEIGESMNYSLTELQNMANNLKYSNGNLAEGIVVRPIEETYSPTLKSRLTGKVISETFELKYA